METSANLLALHADRVEHAVDKILLSRILSIHSNVVQ